VIKQEEEWRLLHHKMGSEGFSYCFVDYSHWNDIKDESFHVLKNNFVKAQEELESYIEDKIEQLDEV